MIKKILSIWVIIILIIPIISCPKKDKKIDKYATKMDTIIHLTAYGPNASKAIDAAFNRVDEIENMASSSINTSDVSKINEAAGKEYVKVHPEIIKIIKTSLKYSKISNGVFDITVNPLIKLWGIGTIDEKIPTDYEIKEKLALVGYSNININEDDNSIRLMKQGMSIDLGGVAKGFTADEIIKVFKEYGVNSAIINLGGSSIYTLGEKTDKTLWKVAIQNPRKEKNEGNICTLNLNERALSTSGDYQKFFIKDGNRYHHILDPATGYPADAGIMSDTIVVDSNIEDCNMISDILTKITFVSGVDKGFKIIDSLDGISCMAVTTDFRIYKSLKWNSRIENLSSDFTMAN
jgi:thiamine biosynthesis lipoprotein